MLCSGESVGTTISSYSPVRRASGVTLARVTGDLLVRMAPTITSPPTRTASPFLPLLETNWARPMVPPAPPMFSTWTPEARLVGLQGGLHGAGGLVPAAAGIGRSDDVEALDLGLGRELRPPARPP